MFIPPLRRLGNRLQRCMCHPYNSQDKMGIKTPQSNPASFPRCNPHLLCNLLGTMVSMYHHNAHLPTRLLLPSQDTLAPTDLIPTVVAQLHLHTVCRDLQAHMHFPRRIHTVQQACLPLDNHQSLRLPMVALHNPIKERQTRRRLATHQFNQDHQLQEAISMVQHLHPT